VWWLVIENFATLVTTKINICNNFMGQGKITAPLSTNVNVLSAFRHLLACWYHANVTLGRKVESGKQKVRCGKWKVEPLIYPDPNFIVLKGGYHIIEAEHYSIFYFISHNPTFLEYNISRI
jgi:hypothetical protein